MLQDLKDFMEKIKEDEALQERMSGIIQSSTQDDVFDNCNAVAAEMGYTIVEDDMKALAEEYQEELGDEELDKMAGGGLGALAFMVSVCALGGGLGFFDRAFNMFESICRSFKAK